VGETPLAVADIWNMALGLIGVADEVQDPDADQSKEATACRRFWQTARDETIREFPWPRLRMTEELQLVTDYTAVDGAEWLYSYRMPDSCAVVRRIPSGVSRVDTAATVIPYALGRDDAGALIFTDLEDATVEFTYLEDDVTRYTPDLVSTIALLLASRIAPRFGPEAVKLGDRAFKLYIERRSAARATALNEVRPDVAIDDSTFLSARDG
jgi:hypothetical protein